MNFYPVNINKNKNKEVSNFPILKLVMQEIRTFENPTIVISNKVYQFLDYGWVDRTDHIKKYIILKHDRIGRLVFSFLLEILTFNIAGCNNGNLYKYFEMTPSKYIKDIKVIEKHSDIAICVPTWEPMKELNKHDVLFTNGALNLLTLTKKNLDKPLFGAIINRPITPEILEIVAQLNNNNFEGLDPQVIFLLGHVFSKSMGGLGNDHFWNVMERLSEIMQPHIHWKHELNFLGSPNTLKSTFAKMIFYGCFGSLGVSELTKDSLCKNKWLYSGLINKFVNISDDSVNNPVWFNLLKNWVGSGTIVVEEKFGPPATLPLTAKFLNISNDLPETKIIDGVIERTQAIFFRNKISSVTKNKKDIYLSNEFWLRNSMRDSVIALLICAGHRLAKRGDYLKEDQIWNDDQKELHFRINPYLTIIKNNISYTGEKDDCLNVHDFVKEFFGIDTFLIQNFIRFLEKVFPKQRNYLNSVNRRNKLFVQGFKKKYHPNEEEKNKENNIKIKVSKKDKIMESLLSSKLIRVANQEVILQDILTALKIKKTPLNLSKIITYLKIMGFEIGKKSKGFYTRLVIVKNCQLI